MPRISRNFPTAQPGSQVPYLMDFTGYLPAGTHLASSSWNLSLDKTLAGFSVDGSPGGHLVGSPANDTTENTSTQIIGGLLAGNDYVVSVTGVDDHGDDIVLWTVLPCRAPGTAAIDADSKVTQLAALEKARNSGVLTVRHADTMTTFRSLAEMDSIIQTLRAEVQGGSQIRRVRILPTKGL